MKYENIDLLDARIERIVSQKVKHYYTDWKNYDRPKYMCFKGSRDIDDKQFFLIVRECGTYIVRLCDIGKSDWATTVFNYYQSQERADYYYVNLNLLTVTRIKIEIVNDFVRKAVTKVNLGNLHRLYWTPNKNLFVNGEVVDGFDEEEVAWAIRNGCEVVCR